MRKKLFIPGQADTGKSFMSLGLISFKAGSGNTNYFIDLKSN